MSNTDALSIFADDMRRSKVPMLGPCINRSLADFSVEVSEEGHVVRYALGALKGVGEGAMEQLCAERAANGAFASLDDLADRISPRLVNRRQLESLAAGGAFDMLESNRAAVHAAAETLLAVAAEAESARTSGQGGLFGGEEHKVVAVQLSDKVHWSLAERMAAEKDAFGFYFSAHPVERYSEVAEAHGARSYAAICAMPMPADGGRAPGTMAVLVEDVKWRTSARGRRYVNASVSDATGQFIASCFDDNATKDLEEAAKANLCVIAHVELDKQPGEETPRVAIKRIQRLDGLASQTRWKAIVSLADPAAIRPLAELLAHKRGGRSEILVEVTPQGAPVQTLRLGKDFDYDSELGARIGDIPGVSGVVHSTTILRLVS